MLSWVLLLCGPGPADDATAPPPAAEPSHPEPGALAPGLRPRHRRVHRGRDPRARRDLRPGAIDPRPGGHRRRRNLDRRQPPLRRPDRRLRLYRTDAARRLKVPLPHCGRGRGPRRRRGRVRAHAAAAPSPGSLCSPPSPAVQERGHRFALGPRAVHAVVDEIVDDARVGQGRDVAQLAGLVRRDLPEDAAHDLAGAGLRQVRAPIAAGRARRSG